VVSPVQLGEYRVEPGAYLVGGIKRTHRRPSLYPDPERFRPERFLERSFTPYEYLPFGGGVRRCLGQAISFRQMTIVMSALLRAFDLRPIGRFGTGEENLGVVTAPSDPLRVAFERWA
jgi:cytochrome P450